MSHNPSENSDKIEVHYRQQLSALVDGELQADEARFLLRRLQHDDELAGCHERWQLCGDVLRGMASAPAPVDFAARVRQAVAAEALAPVAAPPRRHGWRWGGGAIAASVALVALFMTRERMPVDVPAPMPVIATTAQLPARAPAAPQGDGGAGAVAAAVPAAALASARRQDARTVASVTRSQQAARSASGRRQAVPQQVQLASAAPATPQAPRDAPAVADPFAHPGTLQARPWPRSVLAGSGSALNASLEEGVPATFYPFEPRQALPSNESEPVLPPQR